MKFLAINTAGPALEAALSCGGFYRDKDNRKASDTLMPSVDSLLSEAHTGLSELDFIACVTGPGSFTGIRIGVSTVRALCYAVGKPALGINYLQMLAYNERADEYGRILCVTDASNGMAYIAQYGVDRSVISDCKCVLLEDAVETAKSFNGAVCADENIAKYIERAIAPDENCKTLLRAAESLANNVSDYKLLLPVYVRQSQAERDLNERKGHG